MPPARYFSRKSPRKENAKLSKFAEVIVPRNVTLIRLVQPAKAASPMLVTLLGKL